MNPEYLYFYLTVGVVAWAVVSGVIAFVGMGVKWLYGRGLHLKQTAESWRKAQAAQRLMGAEPGFVPISHKLSEGHTVAIIAPEGATYDGQLVDEYNQDIAIESEHPAAARAAEETREKVARIRARLRRRSSKVDPPESSVEEEAVLGIKLADLEVKEFYSVAIFNDGTRVMVDTTIDIAEGEFQRKLDRLLFYGVIIEDEAIRCMKIWRRKHE